MNSGFIVDKKLNIPFVYRFLEGVSTSMFLGCLFAGGWVFYGLFFIYLAHWNASFRYHVKPSYKNLIVDLHFIDMVAMERLVLYTSFHFIYIIFLFLLIIDLNKKNRFISFCKVSGCVSIIMAHNYNIISIQYIYSWILSAIFFLSADLLLCYDFYILSSICHVIFHICIGWTSFLEVDYYKQPPTFNVLQLLVYTLYLWRGIVLCKN